MLLLFTLSQLTSTPLEYSFDDSGKIVFMEVVSTEIGFDTLVQNVENLGFEKVQNGDEEQGFSKEASFMLYNKRISKVPHGRLTYNVQVDVKENRYRYVITDLIFHEYERNRYGRYEEKRNGQMALEPLLAEPDKQWENHKQTILKKMESEVAMLKSEIVAVPLEEEQKSEVKINDDW
ncbi:hypothetical protein E1140_09670 [Fulvivirga lutimaris]|nr:hypothetical protein [Fulvivirga lutimaris]